MKKEIIKTIKNILLGIIIFYAFWGFTIYHSWFHCVGMSYGDKGQRVFSGKRVSSYLVFRPHFLWKYDKNWLDLIIPVAPVTEEVKA